MCGRYTLIQTQGLSERFDAQNDLKELRPNYNASPGQVMPVVTRNSPNRLELMKWGLIPVWAKDPSFASLYKTHNAKSETVLEKPSFRGSFKSRRCLVPISGYYEWKKEGGKNQPYYYELTGQEVFALAGLTADWHDEHGNELQTFTIITTEANSLVAEVHHRMPVILKREDEDVWLDASTPPAHAHSLLRPISPELMTVRKVSTKVGNSSNNYASLLDELGQTTPEPAENSK